MRLPLPAPDDVSYCPHDCPFWTICDWEDAGVCRLDEAREDERHEMGEREYDAMVDDELTEGEEGR